MEEVTETDILVTEGIPLGVSGAHHHVEGLPQGIETGGAGRHLFHAVPDIELDDIAEVEAQFEVGAQFVVVHRLKHIDHGPLLVWRGMHLLLGAGAHRGPGPGPDLLLNLHQELVETAGPGHRPEVQMERKAWSLMAMLLHTRVKGEVCGVEGLGFGLL